MKTIYNVSTGSVTGSYLPVERWVISVWPDNDGNLWYYDENGRTVILED